MQDKIEKVGGPRDIVNKLPVFVLLMDLERMHMKIHSCRLCNPALNNLTVNHPKLGTH